MLEWLLQAKVMVVFHVVLTVLWAIAIPVLILTPRAVQTSVLLVLAISCYANLVGHFSAFQAALADLRSPDN